MGTLTKINSLINEKRNVHGKALITYENVTKKIVAIRFGSGYSIWPLKERPLGEIDKTEPIQTVTRRLYGRQFILMASANFFIITSLSSFFLFPLFITSHGGTKSDIGILMGAMTLSSVLIRPWISAMIDRFGRKRSYLLGTLIMTVMPAVYIVFHGNLADFYTSLFIVRIIHGIGVALSFTAAFTYVADIVPQERLNEGLGAFGITALVGMAVGPAIAEPIIRQLGFDAYFLTGSILGAITLFLLLFLPETYIPRNSQERGISFFTVLRRRKIFSVALLTMLFGAGMAAQGGFPYIEHLKLPYISLFFIAYSSAAIVTRIVGGRLADRVGEERVIPWAFVVSATGFLSLIMVKESWYLIASGLIIGCGHGFIFPCLNALAIRDEPIHIRGKINGVFTGGVDSGLFIGSILLGYIGEWFGYRPIFITTFLILMIGLVIFFGVLAKAVDSSSR
jgi:MFS family permease